VLREIIESDRSVWRQYMQIWFLTQQISSALTPEPISSTLGWSDELNRDCCAFPLHEPAVQTT
jgi:hypothetical protein